MFSGMHFRFESIVSGCFTWLLLGVVRDLWHPNRFVLFHPTSVLDAPTASAQPPAYFGHDHFRQLPLAGCWLPGGIHYCSCLASRWVCSKMDVLASLF
jgi:hypothetical protein